MTNGTNGSSDGVAYFHVAFLVPHIETAMAELGAILEITWRPVHDIVLDLGTGPADVGPRRTRVTFSAGGPPAIELFEWDVAPGGAALERPVIHHIGRWVDDLAGASERLEAIGCPLALTAPDDDGRVGRFALHETSFGVQVELVDVNIPRPSMAGLQPERSS